MSTHCKLILTLAAIFFCRIGPINTLRCADNCDLGFISLNSTEPSPISCRTTDVDPSTSRCTVFLSIDFGRRLAFGTLSVEPRSADESLTSLYTSFWWGPDRTDGIIRYRCAIEDNCDQYFTRSTLAEPRWANLNATKMEQVFSPLLIGPSSLSPTLTCANRQCSPSENCVGIIKQNSSSDAVVLNSNTTCDDFGDPGISFLHTFNERTAREYMWGTVTCNKTDCNRVEVLKQVYDLIKNNFTFPLNYTAVQPESTTIPNTTNVVFINSITIFLSTFFLFLSSRCW